MIKQLVLLVLVYFIQSIYFSVYGDEISDGMPTGLPTPHPIPNPYSLCTFHPNATTPDKLPTSNYYLTATHYKGVTCGRIALTHNADNTTGYGVLNIIQIYVQSGGNVYNDSYVIVHQWNGRYLLIPASNYNGTSNQTIDVLDISTNETATYRYYQIFAADNDMLVVACHANNGTREVYKGVKNPEEDDSSEADQRAKELNVTHYLHPANQSNCPQDYFEISQENRDKLGTCPKKVVSTWPCMSCDTAADTDSCPANLICCPSSSGQDCCTPAVRTS
ncbi:hypothetical protein CHUAL_010827 [Chamberlinius hualienensis]